MKVLIKCEGRACRYARVFLDGVDVSTSVVDLRLDMSVSGTPRLNLELAPDAIEVEADGDVFLNRGRGPQIKERE